ncbi:MAG: hypothetical protein M9942_01935 [Microthrixaceae bacterium]|nr:hypothetical protein [Microthrixaceae bacterium]MCO5317176.1 hypothetical protein [Microthrixaceae bacterium]
MRHTTGPGRTALSVAVAALFSLLVGACGEDQHPWCAELESVVQLDELASSMASGDTEAAAGEVEHFSEVAAEAPGEIRAEMQAVAEALDQVVEVALTGADAAPDDLELRREALNDELGRVTDDVATVSSWAETECGVRLT